MDGACRLTSLAKQFVRALSLDEPIEFIEEVRLLEFVEVLRGLPPCLTSFQPVLKMPSKG
jgi:hypothetical protein